MTAAIGKRRGRALQRRRKAYEGELSDPCVPADRAPAVPGPAAGFAATELQTSGGVWRIDMTKCPYHDASVHYGCPELCTCFCDSDDITYDHLHKRLYWHRTKTLGRGDDCCDFCLRIREEEK